MNSAHVEGEEWRHGDSVVERHFLIFTVQEYTDADGEGIQEHLCGLWVGAGRD